MFVEKLDELPDEMACSVDAAAVRISALEFECMLVLESDIGKL